LAICFDNILNGEYAYPDEQWSDVSEHAKDFIDNLLEVDYERRFTIKQALEHPWLRVIIHLDRRCQNGKLS